MSNPHPVKHNSVEPVHHHKEEVGLEICRLEIGDFIPDKNDRDQHHEQNDAKWNHNLLSFFHDRIFVDQSTFIGFFYIFLWVKINTVHSIISYQTLYHQNKQKTV